MKIGSFIKLKLLVNTVITYWIFSIATRIVIINMVINYSYCNL